MASLDELSEGRAMLGYGAGLSGFHNLGIVSDRPATALREGIYIIRRLWAGEHTTYEGEIISLWDALMKFPTRHDLPIYVAANSPYTLRLAGEVADGVIIPACASKHILEVKLQRVREGQKKAGRVSGPEIVARLDVSLSQNRDAALFEAKVRLARLLWARYPHIEYLQAHDLSLSPELDRRLRQAGPFQRTHDRDAFVHFADVIPDELVFPISLAGTPTEVRNQAQAVVNAGAEQIMAYMLVPGGESVDNVLTLYAEHVLPHLRLKQ
jgi:5,10-methylenetetrahydromethanopterin reductase